MIIMQYMIGDKIIFKNLRNSEHWTANKVGTIVSIDRVIGLGVYLIQCTILDGESCEIKNIKFRLSHLRVKNSLPKIGYSIVVKKPIIKWINRYSRIKFSDRLKLCAKNT